MYLSSNKIIHVLVIMNYYFLLIAKRFQKSQLLRQHFKSLLYENSKYLATLKTASKFYFNGPYGCLESLSKQGRSKKNVKCKNFKFHRKTGDIIIQRNMKFFLGNCVHKSLDDFSLPIK